MAILASMVLAAMLESRAGLVAFQRVAIPEDVPAHLCTAIAQDRQGFVWLGTQRGLVRYDGFDFRVFRANPADPHAIGGNYVRALLVARDGRLWVGTFTGGVSVFDPRTETFTRFDRPLLSYDRVEGLAEDREGGIWIATTAGLDRLDPRTRRVEHFRHDPRDPRSIADDRVRGLLVDRGGTLWVGTRAGLQRRRANGFDRVAPDVAGQYVIRLFEDRRGRIWIGTEEHGAAVLEPRDGNVRRIAPRPHDPEGLSHYWVYGFAEGPADEMWVATFGGGVDVVDATSLAIVDRLRNDATLTDTIGADRIGAMFRDRAGVMWVGTWGEGIARHDPRTRAFRALRFSPSKGDGLTHAAAVRALEMRDGTIWVGTNGNGVDVLDRDLRRITSFRPDLFGDGAITCLAEGDDGTRWVATLDGSLHRIKSGATPFDRVPADRLPGGPIRTIAFTRDGLLWAGAAEGMVRVDPRTLETRVYKQWPGAGSSSPAIESIVAAADGSLWVGSDNGLYSFDPHRETSVRIAKDPSRAEGLPENWVPDLLIARDGRLWVGTAAGACVLTHWDGQTARFERIVPGTPSPAESLIEDEAGHMWIGPRLRVDARTREVRVLGPADGVAFRNFFIASRSKMRDGRLLFGSPEGLLVVDPRLLPNVIEASPVVATALRVEGTARPGAAVLQSLTLSPSERTFSLDFSALEFASAQRQTYRYRLDGLDREWTVTGPSQHSLTISRAPPGDYMLRVGVTNRDSGWSANELRLPVRVQPAFFQTGWFRALVIAAAAALLYAAYRLRVRHLRARERRLHELVAVRTSELETAYAKIEEASLTDPLTGLRNRRFLEQAIGADLDLAARGHGDLVVLLVDLDHFKSVNDTYGHAAGDAVLVALAELLRQTFRSSDHVVRWGGEEFLIVVRFVDRTEAFAIAEKLRRAVAEHAFVLPDGTRLQRTCSIGFAAWPLPGVTSWERTVDLADEALYAAKRGGRNAAVGADRAYLHA
ncbi:MAG TPA: two-component regulator propeller domain-containing protein [Thermoanaerobaculia bacterium]|nr:two-component regulator propeller domain-containing protein [Thermoanaerobaculia bacterium]